MLFLLCRSTNAFYSTTKLSLTFLSPQVWVDHDWFFSLLGVHVSRGKLHLSLSAYERWSPIKRRLLKTIHLVAALSQCTVLIRVLQNPEPALAWQPNKTTRGLQHLPPADTITLRTKLNGRGIDSFSVERCARSPKAYFLCLGGDWTRFTFHVTSLLSVF